MTKNNQHYTKVHKAINLTEKTFDTACRHPLGGDCADDIEDVTCKTCLRIMTAKKRWFDDYT